MAASLVGTRLKRFGSRDPTPPGFVTFPTCGIGRVDGCWRVNCRGADGVTVDPGRAVGRGVCVTFGCTREGVCRGVIWRCGVGRTVGRCWGVERCGVTRGVT
ncbi:hypothetical protein OKA05_06090 [Luteolibacter arcticus]|uniref:SRCR domain-containing protein n=1 Tax=Luteolibacter arcticus TaxID=1581411 RepID=A0ABT3GEX5_9BACT|nr:hypothetical protein [Luteolibacter arcticus]MCW1922114.1 hypothetical protein [Luteolibacter arcticus]